MSNEQKELYDIGEIPPLGHVPEKMHAWLIRREREDIPSKAMREEVVPTPPIKDNEVLVLVMASGVNYNGVWASLGKPVSVFDVHKADFHIAGSDASGIVWAAGKDVTRFKVGDEVIVHCNRDDGSDEECNGGDPMYSTSQRIWGYETPDGAFAQFTNVQERQLMPRAKHLTWEASGCYTLTLATSYRMLFGHEPHHLKPGQNILVWGASGGIGSMAVQLANIIGAHAIGVVSDEKKKDFVMKLGAKAVLNRRDFDCFGDLPDPQDEQAFKSYMKKCYEFGRAVWDVTGKGVDVDMVFEHPGAQTFPLSCLLVKRGGMVVFCAATSGFRLTMDARFVWMRQKRVQGSHFAHLKQASEANRLVIDKRLDPCMAQAFTWKDIPKAHELMMNNKHPSGNMAVLVGAKKEGMTTLEEARKA